HRREKEFFGFATVTATRADGVVSTRHYHNQSYTQKGELTEEDVTDASGALSTVVNTYRSNPIVGPGAPPADQGCVTSAQKELLSDDPFPTSGAMVVTACDSTFRPIVDTVTTAYESGGTLQHDQTFQYNATLGTLTSTQDSGADNALNTGD